MNTRLLLITPDFPPNRGGVARYLDLLAKYFSPQITVVTTGLLYKWFWPQWLASVRLLIKLKNEYDIVITSHILPFGTAAFVASWVTKKPYIVIAHGYDMRLATKRWIKRFLATHVLSQARIVVVNSCALAQEVTQTFFVPSPLVIYPCVDKLPRQKKDDNILSDAKQEVRLLTVSRLVARKGHTQVLMALSQLKQANKLPEFHYTIAGDGPMRQTLEELAGQLHLDEVEFLGEINDEQKTMLYASADLFVMPVVNDPIDKEGFGLVFLEAAQFGVPSISTKMSGIDEAILDQETGILVEPGNTKQLAEAIAYLATQNGERKRLGENARRRVELEFTCEKQFTKLEPYITETTHWDSVGGNNGHRRWRDPAEGGDDSPLARRQGPNVSISIIIPTYQHAQTLERCIRSVFNQTIQPHEIIVIDDGSTDNTKEILDKFANRIIYRFQTNHGAPVARNAGAQLATGSFLIFIDADVQANPNMLEKLIQTLDEHPEASYAYCGFLLGKKRFSSRPFDSEALKRQNYIHTSSLIRREAFHGFDTNLKRLQDWDLWLTLLEQGKKGAAVHEALFTVLDVPGRKGISTWLPSFVYRIPWNWIGWKPKALREYEEARDIVKTKHGLK